MPEDEMDDWMASPTWRTWIWASPGSCWWTGKPGVLQSMGLQRVRQDWKNDLYWKEVKNPTQVEGGDWLYVDHKHIETRMFGTRNLIILIAERLPCYLYPTNQKKFHKLKPSPQMLPSKTVPWKLSGSSGLLRISSQFYLLGIL